MKRPRKKSPTFDPMLNGMDYPQPLIDSVANANIRPVFGTVDMNLFVRGWLGSPSLSLPEKYNVFGSAPTLSQFQLDELMLVFEDESVQFRKSIKTEWPIIAELGAKAWVTANMLANYLNVGYSKMEERQALQAMLAAKYDTSEKRAWLQKALAARDSALLRYVFGAFIESHRQTAKTTGVEVPDAF